MNTGKLIVADFIAVIAKVPGLSVACSGISQNVWEIESSTKFLLYVKGRGEAPYRWGVTANVVERLNVQSCKWFIVLLYDCRDTGYLLSSADVLYYIKNTWPLGGDGDYKPASGTYLSRNSPFSSFNEFLRAIRKEAS